MDPRRPTIDVKLNGTLAELLIKLTGELGSDDASGTLSRALGLLDLAMQSKKRGRRLCVVDGEGNATDVMF